MRAGVAGEQLGKVRVRRSREVMGQPGAPGRPPGDSDFSLRGIGSPGRTVRREGHCHGLGFNCCLENILDQGKSGGQRLVRGQFPKVQPTNLTRSCCFA